MRERRLRDRVVETVYSALERLGAADLARLMVETGLPYSAVRRAIRALVRAGVVRRLPNLEDMRRHIYVLSPRSPRARARARE